MMRMTLIQEVIIGGSHPEIKYLFPLVTGLWTVMTSIAQRSMLGTILTPSFVNFYNHTCCRFFLEKHSSSFSSSSFPPPSPPPPLSPSLPSLSQAGSLPQVSHGCQQSQNSLLTISVSGLVLTMQQTIASSCLLERCNCVTPPSGFDQTAKVAPLMRSCCNCRRLSEMCV